MKIRSIFIMVALLCIIPAYHHYVQSVAGPKLAQEWERMNQKLEVLQREDIQLSAQIHMLQVEIDALKVESEESSLAARTLLGMVRPSELIYQLTSPTVGNEEWLNPNPHHLQI